MKFGLPPDEAPLDERDPLWRVLGGSPLPEPDAWFTVRTLSRIQREAAPKAKWSFRHVMRWSLGGISLCAVLAFSAVQVHTEKTKQKNVQEAFEIMASFDSDSDSNATPSWEETAL
jgi:hypothetical protein